MSDADGSLADLFGGGGGGGARGGGADEPAETGGRSRTKLAWTLRTAVLVAAASAITIAILRSQGIKVSVLLVVAAFLALRLLMWAVSEVAPPPALRPATRGGEESGDYNWAGADTLQLAVRRWERQLDWSRDDHERFSRIVLPALTELADERLRLQHGVTRASDPGRAREIMGEPLWQLLTGPGKRPPKTRDMASYIDALERI